MRTTLAAIAGLVLACSTPTPRCPTCTPSVAVVIPEEAADAAVPRASACWVKGTPKPAAVAASLDPSCAPFDPVELALVEARVRKEFIVYVKPSKLIVDFGCDAAGADVRDVVFEDGSGHGGTLRIARFRREPDRVSVRMIDSSHYFDARIDVQTATIDLRAFDALVASARVALLVRPHLVRLQDRSGGTGGMPSSSHDFHLRVSIIDDDGGVTDRKFTGYDRGSEQERILPMRFASEPFQKLLAATTFATVPATEEDRAWFTARLAIALGGDPYWWVLERYVTLAAKLGTIDAVPFLVTALRAKPGASQDRAREAALAAIAAITGFDPRLDASGKVRPIADAVAAAIAECGP